MTAPVIADKMMKVLMSFIFREQCDDSKCLVKVLGNKCFDDPITLRH